MIFTEIGADLKLLFQSHQANRKQYIKAQVQSSLNALNMGDKSAPERHGRQNVQINKSFLKLAKISLITAPQRAAVGAGDFV